jgi:hypothetical protein
VIGGRAKASEGAIKGEGVITPVEVSEILRLGTRIVVTAATDLTFYATVSEVH